MSDDMYLPYRFRLLVTILAPHQPLHQPEKGKRSGSPEKPGEDLFQLLSITSHLVWGRVVPDIPEFCRELVAALAEE